MITDARVLQPEFIPSEVQHRDAEVNHLSSALDPITSGQSPNPVLLHGPSGAGKTCIAQFIVERLRETTVDVTSQYVNCWDDHTRFKTLYRILDGIDETATIHRQSTPTDHLLERLRNYDGPSYVVILDEVDQLDDKDLLYELYRVRNLSMILITNSEEDLFAALDSRLNSRLSNCVRIHFRSYHDDELVSILQDRVSWGLDPGAIDTGGVELIASNAAGDARVAIGILKRAARTAANNNADTITPSIIQEVTPAAKSDIQQQTLDRLTPHQELLYDIVTEHGTIEPRRLYDAYCDRVDSPKSQRMVRNYLSKLEHYNLIRAEGNTKDRVYHAVTSSV